MTGIPTTEITPGTRVTGHLRRADGNHVPFTGIVTEAYRAEMGGFFIPMVQVACTDGVTRTTLLGDVTSTTREDDDPDLIPTRINGHRVQVATRASNSDDQRVHVIAHTGKKFVVWSCWRDDAGVWQAETGTYLRAYSDALGALFERLGWPTAADHEDEKLAHAGTVRQLVRVRSAIFRAVIDLDTPESGEIGGKVIDDLGRALNA